MSNSSLNVLVIGNGFDLHHKLNTRYSDFVNFCKSAELTGDLKKICENNSFMNYFARVVEANDGWIDCEERIDYILNIFSLIISHFEETHRMMEVKILSSGQRAALKSFKNYMGEGSTGYFQFENRYKGPFREFNKKLFLEDLKSELDDLIILLNYFLDTELEQLNLSTCSEQIKQIKAEYVVNFNYTDTCSKVYGINDGDVFYIHGKLNEVPNNIVFGINDSDSENLDFIYFKKYFQRIQKRTGLLDRSRFYDRTEGNFARVHLFGHSLGETDKETLVQIESLSSQFIIYYLDQPDYESKVINLINLFGKDSVLEKIAVGKFVFEKIQ